MLGNYLFSTALVTVVVNLLVMIGFVFYVPKNRKPNAAIAWLLVIFLLPWIGIILFLLIGNPKLSKRRRNIQVQIDRLISEAVRQFKGNNSRLSPDQINNFKPVVDLCESLGKLPVQSGNTVKIFPDYNDNIDDMVKEIKKAKEFVHLEYFIIALDKTTEPIFLALSDAVKRGVKVRVLIDALRFRHYPNHKKLKKLMTEMGIEYKMMLPIKLKPGYYNRPDLRNHRKVVVIDDRLAYIGSQNLIDRTYHRRDNIVYNELVAKLSGPIARHCSVIFAGDWYAETGEMLTKLVNPKHRPLPKKTGKVSAQILPSGPSYDLQNNAILFTYLFNIARKRIFITNPYFVPNEAMTEALIAAIKRGVEVTMINSEAMDQLLVGNAQRSYYAQLVESGVKLYLYKAPTLLHSKHITIDDDIAVIGSSNLDIRSFELDLECTLITYDSSVVRDLNRVQLNDLKSSNKLVLASWNKRSPFKKFLESAARLTAALQ